MNRRLWLTLAVLVGCASGPAPRPAAAPSGHPPPHATLYMRLGGGEALRAVVAKFLENVAQDARINFIFAMSDLEALQPKLVEFFCAATKGPCVYHGRDMRTAHADLAIGRQHFDALVEDLAKTLDQFKVPEPEKRDLLAMLAPMRGDIVSAH